MCVYISGTARGSQKTTSWTLGSFLPLKRSERLSLHFTLAGKKMLITILQFLLSFLLLLPVHPQALSSYSVCVRLSCVCVLQGGAGQSAGSQEERPEAAQTRLTGKEHFPETHSYVTSPTCGTNTTKTGPVPGGRTALTYDVISMRLLVFSLGQESRYCIYLIFKDLQFTGLI